MQDDGVDNLYSESHAIEHSLRAGQLSKKSCDDKTVQKARERLKYLYEKILFTDYELATSKTVELSLWSTCFYKVIEEYRMRIRKALQEYSKSDKRQKQDKREELRTQCLVFRKFLESSSTFYHKLIHNFQTRYFLKLDGPIPEGERNQFARQYISCHRCLIYLGDLARYHRDLYRDPAQKEWIQAASYYTKALRLWPENGHPHNQLAVLCSYKEDEFRTFYHYFRSLAVKIPFTTARDNLMALFERNRTRLLGKKSPRLRVGHPDSVRERVTDFMQKFVRLHGILFTRTSMETFKKMRESVFYEFELLMQEGSIKESTVLKMFLANIFAVYNASHPPDNQQYVETAQHSVTLQHAITLAMDCFSRVLQQSKGATTTKYKNVTFSDEHHDMEKETPKRKQQNQEKSNPMYVAISVFASWLTTHTDYLRCTDELPVWLRLRELVVDVSNQVLSMKNEDVISLSPVSGVSPLPEDMECQGFLPLGPVLSGVDFSLPPVSETPECDRRRRAKVIKFSLLSSDYDWNENEQFVYFNHQENKFSTSGPVQKKPDGSTSTQKEAVAPSSPKNKSPSFSMDQKPAPFDLLQQEDDLSDILEPTFDDFDIKLNDDDFDHHDYHDDHDDDDDDDIGDEILFAPGQGGPKKDLASPPSSSSARVVGSERTRTIPSTVPTAVVVAVPENQQETPPLGSSYDSHPLFNPPKMHSPVQELHKQGLDMFSPAASPGSIPRHTFENHPASFRSRLPYVPLTSPVRTNPQFASLFFSDVNPYGGSGNNTDADSGEGENPPLEISEIINSPEVGFPFADSDPTSNFASIWSEPSSFFSSSVFTTPKVPGIPSGSNIEPGGMVVGKLPNFGYDPIPPPGVDVGRYPPVSVPGDNFRNSSTDDDEFVPPPPGFAPVTGTGPSFVNESLFATQVGNVPQTTIDMPLYYSDSGGIWGYSNNLHQAGSPLLQTSFPFTGFPKDHLEKQLSMKKLNISNG